MFLRRQPDAHIENNIKIVAVRNGRDIRYVQEYLYNHLILQS